MNILITAAAAGILFISSQCGNAAEAHRISVRAVEFAGVIQPGDTERLARFIKSERQPFSELALNSGGGSIEEAYKLQSLIKILYVTTTVPPGSVCASACFFLFLAGSGRNAAGAESLDPQFAAKYRQLKREHPNLPAPKGVVGLHRPYMAKIDSLESGQTDLMRSVRTKLEDDLVPRRLIDLMMSRPSNDIYWLSTADLEELGQFPAEQEEYFIRKCEYDRRWLDKVISQPEANRAALAAKSNAAQECIGRETARAASKGFDRVRAGWVPQ